MADFQGSQEAIGGYFELSLPNISTAYPHQNSLKYQSARATFRALLRHSPPTKVWMPNYICNAMLIPLLEENVDVAWYDLDEHLNVDSSVSVNKGEWLLYVNYFGVCNKNIESILTRFPKRQVILDCSQSFYFSPDRRALASIYSPRKFFGVPDGGFLVTDLPIAKPFDEDQLSLGRMTHLLKRLYSQPEFGYADYQKAEASLDECMPKKISALTDRILQSIDYPSCQRIRNENCRYLHDRLKHLNHFCLDESSLMNAPLCYPLLTTNPNLKQYLNQNRVFIPTYWNEALDRLGQSDMAKIVRNLVPLPIDHRYGHIEMQHIVDLILGNA